MNGGFGPQKRPKRPTPTQEGFGYFLRAHFQEKLEKKGLSQRFIHRNVSSQFTYKFQSLGGLIL